MHPVLAPGTHVLRRGSHEYQVGLGPGAVAVPGGAPPDAVRLGECTALPQLVRAGLAAADDRALRSALPAVTEDAWHRHGVAALARRCGERFPEVARRREAHLVGVSVFGHRLSRHLAADLAEVCARSGLRVARSPAEAAGSAAATVRVLLGVGEPTRDLLDPWLRDGVAHLLLRFVEGRAVIGPLVVPGRTACLRCIDAYRREQDPAWPLLVEQYARATRADRADGIPEPVDPALAGVAVGWATRELATYVEGGEPASMSTTLTLSPLLDTVDHHRWPRHPHCGCSW